MTAERYLGNLGAFTETELNTVKGSSAGIVGCGGLGGYVCNALARFGVGNLTLIDDDIFTENNLNRQLFATVESLGKNKALTSKELIGEINADINVTAYETMLSEENAAELLFGCDLAVDCLDNIPTRRILARICAELGIPLIHGAISGLFGQVACLYPGDRLFDYIYNPDIEGASVSLGNPVFTPQLVASLQACEAVKVLCGRSSSLRNRVLYIDLNHYSFEIIKFEG